MALLVSYMSTEKGTYLLGFFILLFALTVNVILVGWDIRAYHEEVHKKARVLGEMIQRSLLSSSNPADLAAWESGKFYPQLHLPHSPCISLQWTLRDGKVVNLPAPLIVKGDLIKLCPGTPAPCRCRQVAAGSSVQLARGEHFVPSADQVAPDFTGVRLRRAVQPTLFEALETPFLAGLRLCFEKSWSRPRSLYDKERHTIVATYIEKLTIPLVSIIVITCSVLQYGHFSDPVSSFSLFASVSLRSALVLIPLIPFALPLSWIILNAVGVANLHFMSPGRDETATLLNSTVNRLEKQNWKEVYMDDIDTEIGSDVNEPLPESSVTWSLLSRHVFKLLLNDSMYLWRSSNLLQALGSMTALCCIDKKGILSWPNPTADKVFFLTTPTDPTFAKKDSNLSDFIPSTPDKVSENERVSSEKSPNPGEKSPNVGEKSPTQEEKGRKRRAERKSRYLSRPEVLDVTHDPHSALSLQFDDTSWSRFLSNLKPLGLGILLSTCNPDIEGEYGRFCDHITCESLHNEAAVPVVNKRCLCELSRQIGFTDSAITDYEYLFQMAMFRHVKPEIIHHGKLLNSLNIPRLKMPFPHMASAVIKEKLTNTFQLFSQGTGDLVLDACSEYWDGSDLRHLTDVDRKRILDFYHRSSLTAYCMAFSYVPLPVPPNARIMKDHYLELAPDGSHVFNKSIDLNNIRHEDENDRQNTHSRLSGHYLSNESLIVKEESLRQSTCSSPMSEDVDVETISHQVYNEVFIGMVTMQYQACPDFVQLVEQLEKACIRFVHFSKENELRSRVFSEKMGLEAGWNCHISLHDAEEAKVEETNQKIVVGSKVSLDEPPLTCHATILRSQSAPSAVNLETNVVKFREGETIVSVKSESEVSSESESESESDSLEEEESNKIVSNISPSPSRVTESTGTETGVPIPFDVLNRAKLPKGIKKIRPHLETVDNVPLLVSLFTDCTPGTTCEMISIMQDYGEVVCALGSAANMSNIPTFLQADISIAIEPLYPEVCVTQSIIEGDPHLLDSISADFVSPTCLAKQMISLPASLSLHRQDPLALHRLILEARHFMNNIRNSLQFLLCCTFSLSLAQLMASLLFLPPLLSAGQVLWLVFVVLPFLSFSLMGTPLDPHVMTMATGKNLNLCRESVVYFVLCYLLKFSPSMIVIVSSFAVTLQHLCKINSEPSQIFTSCWMVGIQEGAGSGSGNSLLVCQTFVSFLLITYLGAFSGFFSFSLSGHFFQSTPSFSTSSSSHHLHGICSSISPGMAEEPVEQQALVLHLNCTCSLSVHFLLG